MLKRSAKKLKWMSEVILISLNGSFWIVNTAEFNENCKVASLIYISGSKILLSNLDYYLALELELCRLALNEAYSILFDFFHNYLFRPEGPGLLYYRQSEAGVGTEQGSGSGIAFPCLGVQEVTSRQFPLLFERNPFQN
jgi:hypothetical protein